MTEREGQGARKLSFGLIAFAAFAAVCALGFGALGVWQVERLAWKNSLVAAVEERSTAAPLDLNQADWGAIDTGSSEYQRVSVSGRFEGRDTLSQAVTVYGGGFWVMTPLLLDDGRAVLVNRGFVTADQRDAGVERPVGAVTITGLLRASEPDGGFLRSNDPNAGRWYSRDVAEIGAAGGVENLAPFFIDADASGEGYPVGGLTVLTFSNNHLLYALTWFGLTLLSLFALYWLLRDRFRR
ncbi:SURF1 family protein [Devosia sp. LjRoot3]|uniref:SURF1 family protein n=1 Tax=Devosia sp. LjRoot3 TaxID=3342319 RepID=UPI003ED1205E